MMVAGDDEGGPGGMEPPLTEPTIVQCLYVSGIAIEATPNVLRMVGWVALPDLGGEQIERRIALRCAMPIDAANGLREDLHDVLKR